MAGAPGFLMLLIFIEHVLSQILEIQGYISQCYPEKQNQQDIYIQRERKICYKELAHAIREVDKSKISRVGLAA